MAAMEDEVPAYWVGVNVGPYIKVDDLIAWCRKANNNVSPHSLGQWKMAMAAGRLDEVAAAIPDAAVISLQKDLLDLRDELSDEPEEGP